MIIDLHSHTNYSFCGRNNPELLVTEMIRHGVQVLGITDHNYGIGVRKEQYLQEINTLKEKYADKIRIVCGIEINTAPEYFIDETEDLRGYEYALIEKLDSEDQSVLHGDVVAFAKKYAIPTVIAHTDLFAFLKRMGWNVLETLKSYAENGVAWEMNVNYDSIHRYREHPYVAEFLQNIEQQEIVKASGLAISVGFDGHRVEDYDVVRVQKMCDFLQTKGIKIFLPANR